MGTVAKQGVPKQSFGSMNLYQRKAGKPQEDFLRFATRPGMGYLVLMGPQGHHLSAWRRGSEERLPQLNWKHEDYHSRAIHLIGCQAWLPIRIPIGRVLLAKDLAAQLLRHRCLPPFVSLAERKRREIAAAELEARRLSLARNPSAPNIRFLSARLTNGVLGDIRSWKSLAVKLGCPLEYPLERTPFVSLAERKRREIAAAELEARRLSLARNPSALKLGCPLEYPLDVSSWPKTLLLNCSGTDACCAQGFPRPYVPKDTICQPGGEEAKRDCRS
jgi:hypothetical protein